MDPPAKVDTTYKIETPPEEEILQGESPSDHAPEKIFLNHPG